jgi:hypothetical protein
MATQRNVHLVRYFNYTSIGPGFLVPSLSPARSYFIALPSRIRVSDPSPVLHHDFPHCLFRAQLIDFPFITPEASASLFPRVERSRERRSPLARLESGFFAFGCDGSFSFQQPASERGVKERAVTE